MMAAFNTRLNDAILRTTNCSSPNGLLKVCQSTGQISNLFLFLTRSVLDETVCLDFSGDARHRLRYPDTGKAQGIATSVQQ